MVALNFEPTDENRQQGDFAPIPASTYEAQITASEMKSNKKGTGHYLKLEHEIIGPSNAGRKLFTQLNLDNPNTQAVEIAERELTQICDAVGMARVDDSEDLHWKPFLIDVVIEQTKDYGPQNRIKRYSAKSIRPVQSTKKQPPAQASNKKQPPWAQQGG